MARENRVVFEKAVYHVINKGNRGSEIFTADADRGYFLKKVGEFSVEYSVDIFSYVLMNNHYHLLLRTNLPNLPSFMHRLNLVYTKYFNYKHGTNGHLFQDRYKSFVIDSDNYFISAMRYIALNPVVAGIVDNASEYEWGSFYFLLKENPPDWLKIREALSIAGLNKADFMKLVNIEPVYLNDFLSFESQGRVSKRQIKILVSLVESEIGSLETNKKLKEILIFYLISLGAKQSYIAEIFGINNRSVRRVAARVLREVEKGNKLYSDILQRIKNVLLVPGTKRTIIEEVN